MSEQELKHYGVLGMKWGVSKGSSSSGSSRKIKTRATYRKEQAAKDLANSSADHKKKKVLMKKKVSEMTNDELREVTTRLQLEKSYKDITKNQISPAKKFVRDIVLTTAKTSATNYATKQANTIIDDIVKGKYK